MSGNIEIKARAANFRIQLEKAEKAFGPPAETLEQEDTFFRVSHGRLKLRDFGNGRGQLIFYRRSGERGPRRSDYIIYPAQELEGLKTVLSRALGVLGIVRKKRTVFLPENTRVHFDRVHGLGEFIEIEVLLDGGLTAAEGERLVRRWMAVLDIRPESLVPEAYVDLLLRR